MAPINRGFLTAGMLTVIGTLVFALVYVGNPKGELVSNVGWRMFGAVVGGLVLAQVASRITEYFTSTETKPVQEIAESAATGGPATAVLSGISSGLESSVWAIVAIAGALGCRDRARRRQDSSSRSTSSRSPVWACSPRPVSSCRKTRSVRSPTTRPASRRCRASSRAKPQRDHGEPRRGRQHHQGGHQGIRDRLGGHRRGRVVLVVHRDDQERATESRDHHAATSCSPIPRTAINVADPKTFIGLLIGGSIAFLFSSLAIRAVGRTANVVVQEVRRQFADGKIMTRREAARLRPGHRHLHRGVAAGARNAGAARGARRP